jgi:hypothetical protein
MHDVAGAPKYQFDEENNIFNKKTGRKLKYHLDKDGYYKTMLSDIVYENKYYKRRSCFIHRLIALTFIEKVEGKTQVNHINGIKTDIRTANFEWVNVSENAYHAYKLKLRSAVGEKNGRSKLCVADIIKIRELRKAGKTHQKIADEIPTSRKNVTNILSGKRWSHV